MLSESFLKICGTCRYSCPNFTSDEISVLRKRIWFHQRYVTTLDLLKRKVFSNIIKNRAFCKKENIGVTSLEGACAFWLPIKSLAMEDESMMLPQMKIKSINPEIGSTRKIRKEIEIRKFDHY